MATNGLKMVNEYHLIRSSRNIKMMPYGDACHDLLCSYSMAEISNSLQR